MPYDRRTFLKATAAGSAAAALPASIRTALAIPAQSKTGTIRDVEHVVILMQENRSFDHYFGALRGVRGYGDPRAISLPSGKPVWFQPSTVNNDGYVAPFHMNAQQTRAQCIESLDHSWKKSQELWKNHDAWIKVKGPMTMGHFRRDDIPFYYALADAFTICDAYHCSIFGPTNPNRLFLFTGTSGLMAGNDGLQVIQNPAEETNNFADPALDDARFKPLTWTTYAERLQAAGVDWRVYQEYDNYGDNGLAYFANFRGDGAKSDIGKRARSWPKSSTRQNAATSRGEHLVAEFAVDVAHDRLPQVSWIVAPYIMCEHPAASPGYGEALTSSLLSALAANPKVWAKTAFILNYDENDGFFDHVPPPVPPASPGTGKSTVDLTGEDYHGVPVGLGPRVPMMVASPWTRGGFVNSQLSDHTSVIRFLEARFGVMEPHISPWRRSVCGDLTSMFDFAQKNSTVVALPLTHDTIAAVDESCTLHHPRPPDVQSIPVQEAGQRPARPLPYDIRVSGQLDSQAKTFHLDIENAGRAGVALTVYDRMANAGPWYYAVDTGKQLSDMLPAAAAGCAFELHGPNGFLRSFHDGASGSSLKTTSHYEAKDDVFVVEVTNLATAPVTVKITANDYSSEKPHIIAVPADSTIQDRWEVSSSAHWYDLSVRIAGNNQYLRRFAGHAETGLPSMSDPAFGRPQV